MIDLDGHELTVPLLWRAAARGEPCRLADAARPLLRRSRELVERLAAEPRAIYGINTGFGPLSDTRVPPDELGRHQVNLLHHLAVGQGDLFPPRETRAILVARANALARGYSGIREEVVDLMLAAHRHGVLPEIPQKKKHMDAAKAFLEPKGVPTFPMIEEPFEVLSILSQCRRYMDRG
jgi:histidine ammonia-lyase